MYLTVIFSHFFLFFVCIHRCVVCIMVFEETKTITVCMCVSWYLWRPEVPISCLLQSLSTLSLETGSLIEPGTQSHAWEAWLSNSLILSCPLPCSRVHNTRTPCPGTVVTDTHHHTCVLCGCWGFKPRPSCLCSRPVYQLRQPLALTVYFFLFNVNTNYFVKKTGSEQCIFKQWIPVISFPHVLFLALSLSIIC